LSRGVCMQPMYLSKNPIQLNPMPWVSFSWVHGLGWVVKFLWSLG